MAPASLEQLVEAARQQQRWAERALYERTMPWVERLSFRLMSNRAEAEDVMQESYLQAFSSLSQLRENGRFEAWLRRIVVGTAHKRARRIRWWLRGGRVDPEVEHLVATDPSPERQAELSRALAVVQAMPLDLRTPFVLRHVEGMTIPEIAEATAWSERTVKRRIQDADERLKKRGVRLGPG
ncbi:MAG: RNA polymerase sigma factor [Myxococcota bacterium]